MNQVNKGWN